MKLAHVLSSIALVATIMLAPVALAQEPPKLKMTPLQKEPLTGQPDKEVISLIVEWPPGSGTGLHTHPGDEYTTVLEGEVVGRKEGSEAKTYTAGQSYHTTSPAWFTKRTTRQVPPRKPSTSSWSRRESRSPST